MSPILEMLYNKRKKVKSEKQKVKNQENQKNQKNHGSEKVKIWFKQIK